MNHEPAAHYDRVTAAWTLLLGEELHYGVFDDPATPLAEATARLTELMLEAARLAPGLALLDVGCGTGAPARRIARETGATVTGITTSAEGVARATALAEDAGLASELTFLQRDGMDNGFPDQSFDRVWALESSHLMRHRDRLIAECARVLAPGGRLVLCDIVLRRPLDLMEVRRLREPLALLRAVFGDARMEPLSEYRRLLEDAGLHVDSESDLTAATRPTFERWRQNADQHREQVTELLSAEDWQRFRDSCDVLASFWDDGTLGYGLIAGAKA
ncbi:MAG: class I SAM-dependent methyltransferase [Solirubrobacterales bacterium]|nr:class I SAM-dependent methyltransferase [Solirubrobacterales bacterium]